MQATDLRHGAQAIIRLREGMTQRVGENRHPLQRSGAVARETTAPDFITRSVGPGLRCQCSAPATLLVRQHRTDSITALCDWCGRGYAG
jgi:hypothetical protein